MLAVACASPLAAVAVVVAVVAAVAAAAAAALCAQGSYPCPTPRQRGCARFVLLTTRVIVCTAGFARRKDRLVSWRSQLPKKLPKIDLRLLQ